MALVTLGSIAGQVSGRIASVIFSHNKGGPYARNGSIPTNPNTIYQQNARAALANMSQGWGGLTDVQRLTWSEWALTHPVTNRLGRKTLLSGHQAYVQINNRLYQAGQTLLVLPPIAAPPDPLTALTLSADIGLGTFDLTFTPTPLGATEHLWIYACVLSSAGVTHVENLLRLIDISAAAQATPLDIQTEVEARFGTLQVDQVVVVRVSTFDNATGLISHGMQDRQTVVST